MGGMSLTEADKAYKELMASIEELTESFKQYKGNVKETLQLLPEAVLPCDTEEETKKAAWHLYWKCPQIPARVIAEALGLEKGLGLPAYVGPAYFKIPCPICDETLVEVKQTSRTGHAEGRYIPCESCRIKQEQSKYDAECETQELRHKTEGNWATPETKTMSYAEYLQTDHWKSRRKRALRLAGYKCQLCNRDGALHTHHKTYENLGCEPDDDLIVLCEDCHAKFHDKVQT